jgi:hypothetical protein
MEIRNHTERSSVEERCRHVPQGFPLCNEISRCRNGNNRAQGASSNLLGNVIARKIMLANHKIGDIDTRGISQVPNMYEGRVILESYTSIREHLYTIE